MSRANRRLETQHQAFICSHCEKAVVPLYSGGTNRNHCPYCLWSKHVDLKIGDRRSGCRGEMEPIGIWVKKNREWAIIHRCAKCGFIRTNRIAADDNEVLLFTLAAKPIALLPFPPEKTIQQISEESIQGENI